MKLFILLAVICIPSFGCFSQIKADKEIKGITMCKQEAQIELKKMLENYQEKKIPITSIKIYCKEIPQRWQVS